MQTQGTQDEETRRLVGQLKSVRKSHAAGSPDALREALRGALREALGGLPPDEAGRRVEGARGLLVEEARLREERLESLEAEVASLRKEAETLRAERDRLTSQGAAPKKGAATPAAAGADGSTMERIRAGLRQIVEGGQVTAESLGLPASEARFFRLVSSLLSFALNYETGRQGLLAEFEVGPGGGMNTMMWRQQKKLIASRFRSCLDDEEGSVQALNEALSRNSRFLIDLNEAYLAAFRQGPPEILRALDPQPVLEEFTGRLGMIDHKNAWLKLATIHSDVSNQTAAENWELYFKQPFIKKLADHMGTADSKS